MTVAEAISIVDKLRPNQYQDTFKIKWLSKLDGLIFKEVFMTHADSPIESFEGYDENSQNTELLVPYPYDAGGNFRIFQGRALHFMAIFAPRSAELYQQWFVFFAGKGGGTFQRFERIGACDRFGIGTAAVLKEFPSQRKIINSHCQHQ